MDKSHFTSFFEENLTKIYRFILFKVGSDDIAKDLTSETFARVWKYAKDKDKNEVRDIRAFTYRVARNLVIDSYRQSQKSHVSLEDPSVVVLASDKSSEALRIQENIAVSSEIEQVREAIKNMRPEHAEVVMLHYLEDLPIEEVARVMNQKEGTVRVWLHRGLAELRNMLEQKAGKL